MFQSIICQIKLNNYFDSQLTDSKTNKWHYCLLIKLALQTNVLWSEDSAVCAEFIIACDFIVVNNV